MNSNSWKVRIELNLKKQPEPKRKSTQRKKMSAQQTKGTLFEFGNSNENDAI